VADVDPGLRRIERNTIVACGVMAGMALAGSRGRLEAPFGVLAGGALVAISYGGIKSGIDAVVAAGGGTKRGVQRAIGLVKFFTRYAILIAAAYLIMARWRLPPMAVFAGASPFVIAVMIEALRPPRHDPPSRAR
jgi:hypothetical protein